MNSLSTCPRCTDRFFKVRKTADSDLCPKCKYEANRWIEEVHHIDGNLYNNDPANLRIVKRAR